MNILGLASGILKLFNSVAGMLRERKLMEAGAAKQQIKEIAKTKSATQHWDNNFNLAIDVVQAEDFPLGEDVQKGFYADPKRKLIFGKNEPGLQHFHKSINQALKEG